MGWNFTFFWIGSCSYRWQTGWWRMWSSSCGKQNGYSGGYSWSWGACYLKLLYSTVIYSSVCIAWTAAAETIFKVGKWCPYMGISQSLMDSSLDVWADFPLALIKSITIFSKYGQTLPKLLVHQLEQVTLVFVHLYARIMLQLYTYFTWNSIYYHDDFLVIISKDHSCLAIDYTCQTIVLCRNGAIIHSFVGTSYSG